MAEDIFDAKDLPASSTPGKAPDRFQVLVRLEKNLPEQALNGIANAQGGRIEGLVLAETSPLAGGKGSVYVLSFPDTPARDNIIQALARRPGIEITELDSTQNALLTSTDTHYANGNLWGMLGPTGNGTGPSQITILASQQIAGNNSIEFHVANPTSMWAPTNLLLAPIV